ncbi:MAG: hypothetical protein QGF67_18600 [Lentisphaeria bacterium]|jgi:hypothetical protein|nr:hypothetical protein [Lentisphaeria bacterium]
MNSKPDILLLASDEHNAAVGGYAGDSVIETPAGCRIGTRVFLPSAWYRLP